MGSYRGGIVMQPSLFPIHTQANAASTAHLRRASVTVTEVIPLFETYLAGAGKAKHTIANFRGDVRQLAAFYPKKPLPTFSTADLQLFLGQTQRDRRLSDKTITRNITTLKSLFHFLASVEIVRFDVAAHLLYPSLQPQLPDILTNEEFANLLRVVQDKPEWRALFAVLRYAGPKREEALALQRTDIDLNSNPPAMTLRRRRPSSYNRDRTVPVPPELRAILQPFLAQLQGPHLFPLHERSVQWGMSFYGKQAGIARPLSAQTLRDTFAVNWLRDHLETEREVERLGLRDAYGALVAKHDQQLVQLLGLSDVTAPVATAKYRGLASPVGT